MLHPDDRERLRSASIEAAAKGTRVDIEYRLQRPDGAWMHVRQVIEPLQEQSAAAESIRWFSTLQDITEQKRAEEKIKRLNRVYAVLSGINALIVRVHDRDELFREACRIAVELGQFPLAWTGVVERAEARIRPLAWRGGDETYFRAMPLGVEPANAETYGLAGRAVTERRDVVANDMANDPRVRLRVEAGRRGFGSIAVLPLVVADDAVGVLTLYAREVGFFDDEEMKLLRELAGDISFALDHIKKAEKLDYLAYYDSLTGLANRSLFLERVGQKLFAARTAQRRLAVFYIDVERFKTVNDAFGRQAGDDLLRQISNRLEAASGGPDRLARIGADHFAVVSDEVQTEEEAGRLTEARIATIFDLPHRVGDQDLRISARVGIAMFPDDGEDPETLLRNAEAAVKKAKASGERYLFYTQQMTARIAEKLALESKLRQALEKEEFVLHYQPKVDLETRTIVGVEALIRWQSPERGLVPPL